MIFSCNTTMLAKAIQIVKKTISSSPSLPIFSGIHIIADNNQLEINAMDLNMAISCNIEAEVQEKGEIVVPHKYFSDLISSLEAATVVISRINNRNEINIDAGKANFQISLMDEMDYPAFPKIEGKQRLVLKDSEIKELIKKTIYACSTDESRPLFTGILLEKKGASLTFVGTNTHRLAIKNVLLDNNEEQDLSIIIPARTLKEMLANLNSVLPQDVEISLLNRQIMVKIDRVTIVGSLIEGNFPDYRRVIPPQFEIKTIFNIKELEGAVKRVSLFSKDGDYSIIKISIGAQEITVNSSSQDVGKGKETVSCETTGETLNVAFNSQYILDILKNMDAEQATMELNNSLSPVRIKPQNDENYTYIVTPVRVVF